MCQGVLSWTILQQTNDITLVARAVLKILVHTAIPMHMQFRNSHFLRHGICRTT